MSNPCYTYTETNQFICIANQLTGFYECDIGLIWVTTITLSMEDMHFLRIKYFLCFVCKSLQENNFFIRWRWGIMAHSYHRTFLTFPIISLRWFFMSFLLRSLAETTVSGNIKLPLPGPIYTNDIISVTRNALLKGLSSPGNIVSIISFNPLQINFLFLYPSKYLKIYGPIQT